jgi:hypothetical protein
LSQESGGYFGYYLLLMYYLIIIIDLLFYCFRVFFSDVWAMDSGRLSLQLCEAKVAEHSKPDEIVEPCCACEEAKYEVTFEGLWSEETHPKNFPTSRWLLHFSDIIGASHSADYRSDFKVEYVFLSLNLKSHLMNKMQNCLR